MKTVLNKNPNNKILYDEVLNEYLTLGKMKKVLDCGPGYYLPHHGVLKTRKHYYKIKRFFKYFFNADTTKKYREILIHPDDSCFQMILFRPTPHKNAEDYELQTVTFGVSCAPYFALRTLLQLAGDEENKYHMETKILRESMYVDDALVDGNSLDAVR